MNNYNRQVFTRVFHKTPRARTRIFCTNNKSNISKNNSIETQGIRDILQIVSIATSLCSIIINTSSIYTCYFELSDDLIEVNHKLDTLINRQIINDPLN
jgi:hypothetical protein